MGKASYSAIFALQEKDGDMVDGTIHFSQSYRINWFIGLSHYRSGGSRILDICSFLLHGRPVKAKT